MNLFQLKQMWKKQQESGNFRQKKLVDMIVPSYKEEGTVEHTLDKLMNQTMWRQDLMNIIVGEYSENPLHLNGKKTSYLKELCKKNKFIHVFVPGKGVGYARNVTIMNGSVSDIITNLDADSVFNREDAIELLINPIQRDKVKCTYCETIVVPDKDIKNPSLSYLAYRALLDNAAKFEKIAPFGRSLGLTFAREVFWKVNGFPHINLGEDYTFHWRVSIHYTIWARKFIEEVKVLSSDRRVRAINKDGLSVFDYNKHYRV